MITNLYNISLRDKLVMNMRHVWHYITKRKRTPRSRKLHIGCGEHRLQGDWWHADIYSGDMYLNILKPWASQGIPRRSLDYIYSHHVIEHFSVEQFEQVLWEANDALRIGGVFRIVTPCLKTVLADYDVHPRCKEHMAHYAITTNSPVTPCGYVNAVMRQNGEHVFIYDLHTIRTLAQITGFTVTPSTYGGYHAHAFKGCDESHGYEHIDKISLCVELTKIR